LPVRDPDQRRARRSGISRAALAFLAGAVALWGSGCPLRTGDEAVDGASRARDAIRSAEQAEELRQDAAGAAGAGKDAIGAAGDVDDAVEKYDKGQDALEQLEQYPPAP
jgi:hypothetical protein